MQDPKDIERELFKAAPHAAQKLHAEAKKLIRKQKREQWWRVHATDRAKKPLGS
jgi:hypothetical protein